VLPHGSPTAQKTSDLRYDTENFSATQHYDMLVKMSLLSPYLAASENAEQFLDKRDFSAKLSIKHQERLWQQSPATWDVKPKVPFHHRGDVAAKVQQ
jgi:hypothetical protein